MKKEQKKKVDYIALASPFMRIPRMDVRAARALLDAGIKEVYELRGRDPLSVYTDLKKVNNALESDIVKSLKIAIDFADKDG